jgi:sec-independent protein translocase protein TatA
MFRNPYADGLILLVIVLLFFGPKRLPDLGKSLGHGFREFKDGITGKSNSDNEEADRPAITAAGATTPPAAAPPAGTPSKAASGSEPESAEIGTERRS